MTIKREDLAAAASLGLLQYRQIDPLLVYLLQRDVLAKRAALLATGESQRAHDVNRWLSYVLGTLSLVTVALFGVLFTSRAIGPMSNALLCLFTVGYTLVACGLTMWFRRRAFGSSIRVLTALLMASVPIAVFALQQANH
jgi:hypothetical protein